MIICLMQFLAENLKIFYILKQKISNIKNFQQTEFLGRGKMHKISVSWRKENVCETLPVKITRCVFDILYTSNFAILDDILKILNTYHDLWMLWILIFFEESCSDSPPPIRFLCSWKKDVLDENSVVGGCFKYCSEKMGFFRPKES